MAAPTTANLIVDVAALGGIGVTKWTIEIGTNATTGPTNLLAFPGADGGFQWGGVRETVKAATKTYELPHTDQPTVNFDGPWQYRVKVQAHRGDNVPETYGPFFVDLPTGTTTAYLHDFADTAFVPVDWRDGFRAEMEQIRSEVHDLSQIDTPDALVGTLIETPGSETATALNTAIGDWVDENGGVGGGSAPASSLAPVFVSMIDDGALLSRIPANLRSGLPTTRLPGGEFAEEMQIAVTGAKGSTTLTSTETAKVAGIGSTPWPAALIDTATGRAIFCEVKGGNGSTEIYLRKPLPAAFTGHLAARHDENIGQHLTRIGYKAYAQEVAKATGLTGARGRILSGYWHARPAGISSAYNTTWVKNAALTAWAGGNVDGVLATGYTDTATGIPDNTDLFPVRPSALASGHVYGTYAAGHGAEATMSGRGKDVVLEFFTATHRPNDPKTTAFAQLLVTVTVDGVTAYSATHDHALTHVKIALPQAGKIAVSVTNADGGVYYINLLQTTLREAGVSGPACLGGKGATLGDSWMTYYGGIFEEELARVTGAEIVSVSQGGQTSEWGLDRLPLVIAEKPDFCVIHFFTNDANNLHTSTFTALDGSTKPKWPNLATPAERLAHWRGNMWKIIRALQANGIRPVVIMPGGTAAAGQTQTHAEWAAKLEQPGLIEGWRASTTELANAAAYINAVGKDAGTTAFNLTTSKTVTATGSAATATWVDAAGAVAHTPA